VHHRNRKRSRNRSLCLATIVTTGWSRMNDADIAELSSLRAQLEDLTTRVVAVAERYDESPDSAVASDLFTAERSLRGALRALDRAASHLTP